MVQPTAYLAESVPGGIFPSTHSLLDPVALLSAISALYGLADAQTCLILRHGWNDTYLLRTRADRFVCRVYGAHWHTLPEIQYELDLLLHLQRHGVGVGAPLANGKGQYLAQFHAAEGARYAALFTHVPGRVPQPSPLGSAEQAARFGRSLAHLHQAAATFTSPYSRAPRDMHRLVDLPLALMEPYIAHRPDDWAYLVAVATEVRQGLAAAAASGLGRGVVHGDPTSANATITDDLRVSWFDFDLCGPGWPMADVASARASIMLSDKEPSERARAWQAFLEGYRARRNLPPQDFNALPLLDVANHFYFIALNLRKGAIYGNGYWGSDAFFDHWLGWLRASVARMHAAPS